MILILIAAAASQIIYDELKAPETPPPFSAKVEVQARTLGARVGKEHSKYNGPFMRANATYVAALGSPAHSPGWERAKLAQHELIEACQGYRLALRAQMDFMQGIVANGSRHDAEIAMLALGTYTFVVKGEEDHLLQAALDYDELVTFGRGRNKNGSDPNGKQ